jgi:hypothetical protein
MSKRLSLILLGVILIIGFILRLYRFDGPIADWHSWRQADTSSVSRVFVEEGFDVLHPKFHDLSNVQTGGKLENPNGYRFVEFPIYNLLQATSFKYIGILTLEEWGRLITIIFTLLTVVFIYGILRRYADEYVALGAAAFYSFIPYNIYYGRVILPDPIMISSIVGGIFFFILWIDEYKKNKKTIMLFLYFLLMLVFTAGAFLLKPFALFFTLPFGAVAYSVFGKDFIKKWPIWAFLILSLIPLILWRQWMMHFPEGIPISAWLFNEGNIRFKGSFFYWLFSRRIGGLIMGYWLTPVFVLGLLLNSKSEKLFSFRKGQMLLLWSFLASALLYMFTITRGNVQHDYYQILIVPSLAVFVGLGFKFFINPPKEYFSKKFGLIVLLTCVVFTLAFRWYVIRDLFNINNPSIIAAGAAVDRLTPKNAKVIANYDGDTSFLYQTKRKGWASYEKDIQEMVDKLGAQYLVIANPTPSDDYYKSRYLIVESTSQYIIFDLTKKP